MKFLRVKLDDGRFAIGIMHELGRVERLLVSEPSEQADAITRRAVDAMNACETLSDATLSTMARGGTQLGDLGERVALSYALAGHNGALWHRLMTRVRTIIKEEGGRI